ncbi:MAG: helix-turn-helix domain-containing protein [Candidatus Omnitrophica bacterium]|nr:helix-turn-helix domain-containing protein [Candidatus Omnitrophota bacterium]
MPTVSEQLRQAREAQNLTVYQVAEVTKIKTDHIRALEQGDFNCFSAPIYIRGFVRVYASVLKLDVSQIIGALNAELGQLEKFRETPNFVGESHGWLDFVMLEFAKLNWRITLGIFVLLLVVVLGIWGFLAWQSRPPEDPLAGLGPGLYQSPASGPDQVLPLPTNTVHSAQK